MTEERLIEILRRVSKDDSYKIIMNGNTAKVEGNTAWILEDVNYCRPYDLNTLVIMRNADYTFIISLEGSIFDLEICEQVNINTL